MTPMRYTFRGVHCTAVVWCLYGMLLPAMLRGDDPSALGGPEPIAARLSECWENLAGNEPFASHALLELSSSPQPCIAFLKTELQPLRLDAAQARDLLADLGSNDERVWRPAFETLEYLDPRLAIDLETLMAEVVESPARGRLAALLSGREAESLDGLTIQLRRVGDDGFNFVAQGRGSWWAEHQVGRLRSGGFSNRKPYWTRAVRALVLLEHLGTPEAYDIISRMATGHPEAEPTLVAQGILEARKLRETEAPLPSTDTDRNRK